jgi:hypothetical protein
VQLDYIPTVGTLTLSRTIGGSTITMTQVAATATPAEGEVAVDWVTGLLKFAAADAGRAIAATYGTKGSLAGALLLNRIQRAIEYNRSYSATRAYIPLDSSTVFVGGAGNATANGFGNVAIGILAGEDLTSAAQCVLIGRQAGKNITGGAGDEGIANVCVGESAGQFLTTGRDNVLIGSDAGGDGIDAAGITIGDHNTAVGNNAGQTVVSSTNTNQTGSSNTGLGHNSVWGAVGSYQTSLGAGTRTNRENQIALGRIEGTDEILLPGSVTLMPTDQTISAAGTTINSDRSVTRITTASNYTLTSTPTIATGFDGQVLTIINSSTSVIVIADDASLSGSTLRLGVSTIALGQDESITLQFSTGRGWVRIAGGVGTMASQDASAVAITGGTISTTGASEKLIPAIELSADSAWSVVNSSAARSNAEGDASMWMGVNELPGTIISALNIVNENSNTTAAEIVVSLEYSNSSGALTTVESFNLGNTAAGVAKRTGTLASAHTMVTGRAYFIKVYSAGSDSKTVYSVGYATTTRPQ